jgi:hypothetical protein
LQHESFLRFNSTDLCFVDHLDKSNALPNLGKQTSAILSLRRGIRVAFSVFDNLCARRISTKPFKTARDVDISDHDWAVASFFNVPLLIHLARTDAVRDGPTRAKSRS